MPATKHDSAEYQFGRQMPRAAKRVCIPGNAHTYADTAICTDDFKDNVERGLALVSSASATISQTYEVDWIALELTCFDRCDREN